MLAAIFERLDQWVSAENHDAVVEGFLSLPKSIFRVVGQAALLEAKLQFSVAATVDVDVLNNAKHEVVAKLGELLVAEGLELDPLSNQIWMPSETEYIMVSKSLKSTAKNKALLRSYIASRPPEIFFTLCEKYKVDLSLIIEG